MFGTRTLGDGITYAKVGRPAEEPVDDVAQVERAIDGSLTNG